MFAAFGRFGFGFADGICNRQQIIAGSLDGRAVGFQADDLPFLWRGDPIGVSFAQVVGAGFRLLGKRADDNARFGMHIGERAIGRFRAADFGTGAKHTGSVVQAAARLSGYAGPEGRPRVQAS